jgi:hypothetical protein
MQIMAVKIQYNYVKNFVTCVNNHSKNINISKNKNLDLNPYFYERQQL